MYTTFLPVVSVLMLLLVLPQEAQILGRRFKKIDKPFSYKLQVLGEVSAVSLLKCNVECSVLPGCLALKYKRTTYQCTMYRHLSVTDGRGSPVSLDQVSDDARIYAISEASVSAAAPAPQRTQRNRPKCSFRPKCPKGGPRGVSCQCSFSSRCVDVPRVDCIAGRCVCEVGYSFDHKANTCRSLAECTSFQDSFTTYDAKQIKHHSVTNMTYVSYYNCVRVCRNYTQAMCKSVSVETLSHKCFLHNTTWLEVQETHRKAEVFRSLFQRDCCW